MKIRSHLLMLALGVLAPMVVFAALTAFFLVQHERETMQRDAIGRARSTMSALDAELKGHIETALVLASSRNLETGDIRAFHEESRRVLRSQPRWLNVGLTSTAEKQLSDAVLPYGSDFPPPSDLDSLSLVLRTGKPAIGDVAAGQAIGKASVRIRVPVIQDGSVRYVVTVPLKPGLFEELLREQRLPPDWIIALADRNKRFVARIPPAPLGNPVSESFKAAIEKAPEGWFRGRTIEGLETYTPYVTSELSGWVLGIAIPQRTVEAGERRAVMYVGAGVAAAGAMALWLALLFGGRIARPITALAAAAEAGEAVPDREVPVGREIEELTRLRRALNERQGLILREREALQAADRAKDEFLAMLSHELRNPLAGLTMASQLLRLAEPASEAALSARAVIERQTRQMSRLVEDLIDVSRISAGKVGLQLAPLDLGALVAVSLESWRAGGRFDRHPLSVDAASVWVNADRSRLEQILANLVDNALKFTSAGKPVRVRVGRKGGEAILEVEDEGEGIAPEALEGIFGLFVQGDHGLERAKGGMGVGLTLVRRLAEMQGGRASATSGGRGKGACFSVAFPALETPATVDTARAKPAPAPSVARSLRILLIEDNDDTRRMVGAALALAGHDVKEAHDGNAGLALAEHARCDIAFVDIGLPGVDGYEVARRLRSNAATRNMRLIALTGYGQSSDQARARAAGFDLHLTKPVSVADVETAVATAAPSNHPPA